MRKCCCCISVHFGSVILGVLAVALAILELVALIPYLIGVDPEVFNPIEKNSNHVFYLAESLLEEHNLPEDEQEDFLRTARNYLWVVLLVETILTAVYMLCAVLMISGIKCRKRGLMIPYLIYQLLLIFVIVGLAAALCFVFFLTSYIMGAICLGVTLVVAFLLIYFWMAVQRAFVEIGNRDYMYSPAPVKPIYNPPVDNRYHGQPTAPQHFQME